MKFDRASRAKRFPHLFGRTFSLAVLQLRATSIRAGGSPRKKARICVTSPICFQIISAQRHPSACLHRTYGHRLPVSSPHTHILTPTPIRTLSSQEQPTRYIPAWGGFCSWGISEEDWWTAENLGPQADPNMWLITDDGILHFFRR